MSYLFESEQFGLSETGFHFLRSRFNYKTLNYSEITKVEFKRGHSIKNWIFILILGIIALVTSVIWVFGIVLFFDEGKGQIHIEELVSPVVLTFFGVFFIYKSFQKTDTIHVYFDRKHDYFNLEKIENKNEIIQFFKSKIGKYSVLSEI